MIIRSAPAKDVLENASLSRENIPLFFLSRVSIALFGRRAKEEEEEEELVGRKGMRERGGKKEKKIGKNRAMGRRVFDLSSGRVPRGSRWRDRALRHVAFQF